MDAILKVIAANPQLLQVLIDAVVKALAEEAAKNPDFLAKFIKSLIELFDGK